MYANGVAIHCSPYDLSLLFACGLPVEARASAPGAGLAFETSPRVVSNVVSSPQLAKAMLKLLADNVEAYEQKHGQIPVGDRRGPQAR